jgi:two-component system C4-dicarboxylate transport sensor histidine kinase DctB
MAVQPRAATELQEQAEHRNGSKYVGYLLFLLVALPICCFPLLQSQGLRLTLAPFLYLIATQRWGLKRGLIAALLLTAPGLWLWGTWFKPIIAVGQVLFVCRMQRHRLLMAESTTLFDLTVIPLPALVAVEFDQISLPISILGLAQFMLAHVLMAAAADVLTQNFTFVMRIPFLTARPTRSLEGSIRAMINFVVAMLFCVALVNEMESINRIESSYRAQLRSIIMHTRHLQPDGAGHSIDRVLDLQLYDGVHIKLFVSDHKEGFEERAIERLSPACRAFSYVNSASPDATPMHSWSKLCEIDQIRNGDRTLMTAASFHDHLSRRYSWMTGELIVLFLAGLFALSYRVSLTRALQRTMSGGVHTIMRFGEPNLPLPAKQPFGEFDDPLRRFVELNNSYVATVEERDRLVAVARGLQRSIDLRLMREIRFDPDTGLLHFEEIRISDGPLQREVKIHPADHPYFIAADASDEAVVEFRVAGAEALETYLVNLRRSEGRLRWASGIGIRLRQPQRLHDLMLRQARLVDLGNMAAAITHEVKQPLFTIAMAAESIRIILEKRGPAIDDEPLDRCVTRIATQVDRAREIIRRISRYGHLDTLDPAGCDAAAAMEAAHSFLLPLLDERGIEVVLNFAPGIHWVNVSRIALEQVMVNAIQNAADAILTARATRREAGLMTLSIDRQGDRIRCSIGDDGVGLDIGVEDTAFEAFFTTKTIDNGTGLGLFISRQIVTDAGGSIALVPNADHGAALVVMLPIGAELAAE